MTLLIITFLNSCVYHWFAISNTSLVQVSQRLYRRQFSQILKSKNPARSNEQCCHISIYLYGITFCKIKLLISHCNYEVINNELECMWKETVMAVENPFVVIPDGL